MSETKRRATRLYLEDWRVGRGPESGRLIRVLERQRYVLVYPRVGAIEGWRRPSPIEFDQVMGDGYYGGIEIHSIDPLDDGMVEIDNCTFTGGKCWTDGSSLAYHERLSPIWGSDETVFAELVSWAHNRFGTLVEGYEFSEIEEVRP